MLIKDHKTDPRILRTHRLLRDALFSLLYDHNFESITIQDIAERATLNRGTFYLHYTSKSHLLEQSISDIFDELVRDLESCLAEDSETTFDKKQLVELFQTIFNHVSKHFSVYKFMLVTRDITQFRPQLKTLLKNVVFRDSPLKYRINHSLEVPDEIVLTYETAALVGIITWWLESDMQHSTAFMASKMAQITMTSPFNFVGDSHQLTGGLR